MRPMEPGEATETTTAEEQLPEQKDVTTSSGAAMTGGIPAGGALDRIIPDRTVSNVPPERLEAGERNPDVASDQTGEVNRRKAA